jgi:hypothetical protein
MKKTPCVLMILGCGPIFSDDGTPIADRGADRTRRRIQAGIDALYAPESEEEIDAIILCGGLFYSAIPLSLQMLSELGSHEAVTIPIYCETRSLDTFGNLHFGLKVLKEKGITKPRLLVVSEADHLKRVRATLDKMKDEVECCIPYSANPLYKPGLLEKVSESLLFLVHRFGSPDPNQNLVSKLVCWWRHRWWQKNYSH